MDLLRYITDYGEIIISFILAIMTLIFFLSNIFSCIKLRRSGRLSSLLESLPELLLTSEALFPNSGEKTGTQKRFSVLSYIENYCSINNLPFDEDYWLSQIEAVLSTPQKKYIREVSKNETYKDSKKG